MPFQAAAVILPGQTRSSVHGACLQLTCEQVSMGLIQALASVQCVLPFEAAAVILLGQVLALAHAACLELTSAQISLSLI